MLQQHYYGECGGFRAQNASAERNDMEISCPCALKLFIRPATFGTHQRCYRGRSMHDETLQGLASSLGKHHSQTFGGHRIKCYRRTDLRQKCSSRLLCRFQRDALPATNTLRGVRLVPQVNVSVSRDQRRHLADAELSRLLHHQIELLTLQQRDAQIKL